MFGKKKKAPLEEWLSSYNKEQKEMAFQECVKLKGNYSKEIAKLLQNYTGLCLKYGVEKKFLQSLKSIELDFRDFDGNAVDFSLLENLEDLMIDGFNLPNLPVEITKLKNLTKIGLYDFSVALPPELWKMKQLKELALTDDNLVTLPSEILQLENLEEISLDGLDDNMDLADVLRKISQLKKVKSLYLFNWNIAILPEEITALKQVDFLCLQGWTNLDLADAFQKISQLESLTSLNLDYNQIKYVPASIGELQNIEELSLASNRVITVHENIGKLQKIHTLDLLYNPCLDLEDVNQKIGSLPSLKNLLLSSTHNGETVVFEEGQFKHLEILNLLLYGKSPFFHSLKWLENLKILNIDFKMLGRDQSEIINFMDNEYITYNDRNIVALMQGFSQVHEAEKLILKEHDILKQKRKEIQALLPDTEINLRMSEK